MTRRRNRRERPSAGAYRVEELARAAAVTVDTIRYYQARGLLPRPRREGRVAVYGPEHLERLRRIRALQRQGLPLALIRRVLDGRLGQAEADLAVAVAAAVAGGDEEFFPIEELARRSGVPTGLLRTVQRAGLALGRTVDSEERFTQADVEVVRLGLRLLEAGLPLGELLELGRRYHEVARDVAERAVQLFDEHVRRPIRAGSTDQTQAAERLVGAFRELLPATTALVAHHFRRLLLQVAMEYIERVGDREEVEASRAEARRLRETSWA